MIFLKHFGEIWDNLRKTLKYKSLKLKKVTKTLKKTFKANKSNLMTTDFKNIL